MTHLLLTLLLSASAQDQLEGAEIGDKVQAMTLATDGKYTAERKEKTGKTLAKGTWTMDGDQLHVKVTGCKGPSCKGFGQSFNSTIGVESDRAMMVRTAPEGTPFETGSYYCHYQGCEKRVGVELVMHKSKAGVMRYLLDALIQKNRGRDVTVVWWGKRNLSPQAKTRVSYCKRDPARDQPAAEAVAKDLADMPSMTPGPVEANDAADCLWDVRVDVGDSSVVPAGVGGPSAP